MVSTVDQDEIQAFSKDSDRWWDENGPFKPLHRLNPVRLQYIKHSICKHYNRDSKGLSSLEGLKILDIGCGGGLVCEPLARLGANVTGVDADEQAISVARSHTAENLGNLAYIHGAAEDLDQQYDVVLALEIIEHVTDPAEFIAIIKKLVKPDGIVILSTLNRNPKSFLLGILAAEYILRWVPAGTHNWKKFVRPSEMARMLRSQKLNPRDVTGIVYDPIKDEFALSSMDLDVNYILCASAS